MNAPKTIESILCRGGFGSYEYSLKGHPDVMLQSGLRIEVKTQGDSLSTEQRQELEWMTERGQLWMILQEVGLKAGGGPVIRITDLQTYDLYQENRSRKTCDWMLRVSPLGTVQKQRYTASGGISIKILCAKCRRPVWKHLPNVRIEGLEMQHCKKCGDSGRRKPHMLPATVRLIRKAKQRNINLRGLAKELGLSYNAVCMVAQRRTWKHITS